MAYLSVWDELHSHVLHVLSKRPTVSLLFSPHFHSWSPALQKVVRSWRFDPKQPNPHEMSLIKPSFFLTREPNVL